MEDYCPILVIADSRGRYLRRELDRVFIYLDYALIWRPGLGYGRKKIRENVYRNIDNYEQ